MRWRLKTKSFRSGAITERMTVFAQAVDETSPYHKQTWLTYYGRPGIPVMGILGEYDDIDELADILIEQARDYEIANGWDLSVSPAFHLVYGMATKAAGDDGSHLAYLEDEIVMDYITKAAEADFGVILDVQIGALSPVEAISKALPYLEYEHVHLAIDPEFAMAHPGQFWPGDPIGYVTAEQVNEVQKSIQRYLRSNRLQGERVLLVHQFQSNMILEPEKIARDVDQVAVTVSVDGWGGPWAKISKYNSLVTPDSPYVAFKLFYRWDEPILTPKQALGEEWDPGTELFIDVTPNMIIYQSRGSSGRPPFPEFELTRLRDQHRNRPASSRTPVVACLVFPAHAVPRGLGRRTLVHFEVSRRLGLNLEPLPPRRGQPGREGWSRRIRHREARTPTARRRGSDRERWPACPAAQ